MQRYTRLKQEAVDDVGAALVVDAEIFRLDALIRWLDSADARVRRLPAPGVKPLRAPSGPKRRQAVRS